MVAGVKYQILHLLVKFTLTLWLFAQTEGEVIIVKEPSSLLIPADKVGMFSCKALCNGVPSCWGYWIINGTPRYTVSEPRMNSTYQENTSENENTLTLTVNASEAMNGTSIQCRYEADGDNNGSDKSATVFLYLILSPPISDNPFIFKNSTHVTLMWSPSFLWPGQRIRHYNISVTNKNDGINSHHMVDSSFTDPAVSFLMSWSYFQSNTLTCRGIMFSISPVTESTSELMQTITISDWIWDLLSDIAVAQEFIIPTINASVLFKADDTPALVQVYAQLPSSNCSYKDLNHTFILENEQGHLMAAIDAFPSFDSGVIKESVALSLKENQAYFLRLQVTVHSQTITSQKYIFNTYKQLQNVSSYNLLCNTWKEVTIKSVQVYVALTGVFTASTILLLVVLVLVITFLFIQYRKGMIGEKKVCKVMVQNPIYEGDGPVYESVQTQREMNSVTESIMPQSDITTDGQNNNFYQSLSDAARYIERPLQLHQYLYTNTASDGSDTGTPTDTPTSETMPLTTPRVMALKKNGQERNKLHLTLPLGGNDSSNNLTMANDTAPESVVKTSAVAPGDVDEVYIEMSPAGAQCHSLNSE